jgi:hypothetical protein
MTSSWRLALLVTCGAACGHGDDDDDRDAAAQAPDGGVAPDAGLDAGLDAEVPVPDPTLDPGHISTSELSDQESESHVAVAPDGRVAAAWIGLGGGASSSIGYAFSLDGGATWGDPEIMENVSGADVADPSLAVGPDGALFLAWLEFQVDLAGNTFGTHVWAARAPAGTTAFADAVEVTDPADEAVADKPWIAGQADGTLLVAYMRQTGNAGHTSSLVAARSTDGQAFSSALVVDEGVEINHLPFVCWSASRVYVTHIRYSRVTEERHVMLRWSMDEGRTWNADDVTEVSLPEEDNAAFDDPGCVASGDDVWVVYGLTSETPSVDGFGKLDAIRVAHSSEGGETIDDRIDAQDAQAGTYFLHPQLAREDGGALDLAYYAGDAAGDRSASIRWSRAPDAGAFEPSVVLHEPVTLTDERSGARWLGDYFGFAVRGSNLYSAYIDNDGARTHVGYLRTSVLPGS